jgi:hypothetical protein
MAKQVKAKQVEAAIPEKELTGIVTVELTKDHPLFNPKVKSQRVKVPAKLAAKGVRLGHFKLVK